MHSALVDSGANGGLLGEDMQILDHAPNGLMSVTGAVGNEVTNLKLAQVAASVEMMADGPIIVIMSQCANFSQGQTIHSKGKMEHFGALIDSKSCTEGGKQCIIAPKRHTISQGT